MKGLAAVGLVGLAGMCGYYIFHELIGGTKLSNNQLFNEVFEEVRNHPEVTGRLGSPVKGYGRDHGGKREGRRNFIESDEYHDEDGVFVLRIKFNLKGPRGTGRMYAEKKQGSSKYEYLIFEVPGRGGNEAIALIDNRVELTREEVQEKVAIKLKEVGATFYGHSQDPHTARQKAELGEFADVVRFVMCDDPNNRDECEKLNLKGYPTLRVEKPIPQMVAAFKPLHELREIVKRQV